MSKINCLPSEAAAVTAIIVPDARGAGSVTSTYVNMGLFERVQFIIQTGEMAATSTLNASIVQATDASGTGVKALTTAKAITELGATDDNKQVIVNVLAEDLDMANNFDFAAITCVVANASVDYAVVGVAHNPRYAPASDNDASTVDEIVS